MTLPLGVELAATWAGRTRVVGLIGARFVDLAGGSHTITAGLVAFAQSLDIPSPPVPGVAGPSGAFGFHGLPGLAALEYPDDEPMASPPHSSSFVVLVADRLGRFLPALFTIDVPVVRSVESPSGTVALPLVDVPLFSAPSRAVNAGLCAIRAELWDRDTDEPARHALVRVAVGDKRCSGVSDVNGQVLVLCAYPLADRLRLGSPPGTAAGAARQAWPVTVEVFSEPSLPSAPVPPGDAFFPEPWRALPGLPDILEGQPRALVFADPNDAGASAWTGELSYRRELVLRSTSHSRLLISRSVSPP